MGGKVTPLDVQQKEFRVTRVGSGYRMREVDEFLDQITDTLSALVAENERLRMSGGGARLRRRSSLAPRPRRTVPTPARWMRSSNERRGSSKISAASSRRTPKSCDP